MDTMANRIKAVLDERGMKPVDLIRQKVLSKAGVYLLLNGTTQADKVRATTIDRLCKALGVNWRWLSTGKGPRDAERLSSAPTPDKSPGPARSVSQFGRPDPDILHEALTLLAFSEEQSGSYSGRARTQELCRLYEWVERDGGRLSDSSNDAFEASVWARRNRLGGADDRANTPTRKRRARGG